jgi:hypothetical protein
MKLEGLYEKKISILSSWFIMNKNWFIN